MSIFSTISPPTGLPLALHEMIWGHSPSDLFQMGGPVMWPLLACSVLAIAIILERALVFLRVRTVPKRLAENAAAAYAGGQVAEARAVLRGSRHPVARVLERQIDLAGTDRTLRAESVRRDGGELLERLEARLSPLLLVSQIAPLLGLLGTVSGLVGSFWKLEQINGPVEPSDLAAGIWAALLTTVFGLIVAIPASAAWHLLQDRADAVARHMGFAVTRLEEALVGPSAGPAASPPAIPAASAAEE